MPISLQPVGVLSRTYNYKNTPVNPSFHIDTPLVQGSPLLHETHDPSCKSTKT